MPAPLRLHHDQIVSWLRQTEPAQLTQLWDWANGTRQLHVGDAVHLRGLIEFSNHCVRLCAYCGLRAPNDALDRYRMTAGEILQCARDAVAFGYGAVVLQSGEDPGTDTEWMADVVRGIKHDTPLAVTLSLGERSPSDLAAWRRAGADRYLLRFETGNRQLYERIHPPHPGTRSDRLQILATLRALGYEVGSGVMIGIPGQSYEDLARDIELFGELDLDMIGVGPYLIHPHTPLGQTGPRPVLPGDRQVPADELTTYKVIALARLVCPRANIPSTTALATLNRRSGRELGLARGANVIMPNLTPPHYRACYEIYPNKACLRETADACHACLNGRLKAIGRRAGQGRGDSLNYQSRRRRADGEGNES
jgi:biotin synthase